MFQDWKKDPEFRKEYDYIDDNDKLIMNKQSKKKSAIKCKNKPEKTNTKLSSFIKTNEKGFLVLKNETPLWVSKIISDIVQSNSCDDVYATNFIMQEIKYCLSYMSKRFSSLLEIHNHYDNNYKDYNDFARKINGSKVTKDDLFYINWHAMMYGSSFLAAAEREGYYHRSVEESSVIEVIKSIHSHACHMIHCQLVESLLLLDLDYIK